MLKSLIKLQTLPFTSYRNPIGFATKYPRGLAVLLVECACIKLTVIPRAGSVQHISWQSLICAMFETMFLWLSITPLGSPVVPLEYGRTAVSSMLPVKRTSEVSTPSCSICPMSKVPAGMSDADSRPGAMMKRGFVCVPVSLIASCTVWRMADSVTIALGWQSLSCSEISSETVDSNIWSNSQPFEKSPICEMTKNSHSSKKKADISTRTDKAVHSMLAMNAMSAAELSSFITFTLYVCVHLHNTPNEGPRSPLLPIACEAVLAPQPGCTLRRKYYVSGYSQTLNLPLPLTTQITLSRLLPKMDRLHCC